MYYIILTVRLYFSKIYNITNIIEIRSHPILLSDYNIYLSDIILICKQFCTCQLCFTCSATFLSLTKLLSVLPKNFFGGRIGRVTFGALKVVESRQILVIKNN